MSPFFVYACIVGEFFFVFAVVCAKYSRCQASIFHWFGLAVAIAATWVALVSPCSSDHPRVALLSLSLLITGGKMTDGDAKHCEGSSDGRV